MYILMYIMDMAKTYSVAGARTHLPAILDEVEAGKDVQLTRRGRLVAVVLSAEKYEMLRGDRVAGFRSAYRAFLKRYPTKMIGLEDDFLDSLRDRGPGRRVRL